MNGVGTDKGIKQGTNLLKGCIQVSKIPFSFFFFNMALLPYYLLFSLSS